jgi:F-type H+-transporting ATPase subunit b
VDQFGLNGWQFAVQAIAFLAFIYLLWKFAAGPIVRMIDERQDRIRESLASAERMQQELKDTQARNEEVLQQARVEAQEIISTARKNGDQMLSAAQERADAQAQEYLAKAQATLRQETDQARVQLRQEVADLAVTAAGRILHKELDPAAQAQLIEETLAGASKASQN